MIVSSKKDGDDIILNTANISIGKININKIVLLDDDGYYDVSLNSQKLVNGKIKSSTHINFLIDID